MYTEEIVMTDEAQLNRRVPPIASARAILFISLPVVMLSAGHAVAAGTNKITETTQIRKQFVEFYIAKANAGVSVDDMPVDDVSVATYMKTLQADGTWADINYESKRRAKWDVVDHLRRVQAMAIAHANPESKYYGRKELKEKVLTGLDHWLRKDYQNPNWFNGTIRVPKIFSQTCVLLGEDLPEPMLRKALETVLGRTEISRTGQNRVWCSGIVLTRGVLTGDHRTMREASEAIWAEVKVTTEEGIQADWTFHQHGPQIQMGVYGLSFAKEIVQWASVLRGTSYAPGSENLALLRNYMLEGMAWFYWKGRMDLSSIGRLVRKGRQKQLGQDLFNVSTPMIDIDPENAKRYDLDAYQLTGFKGYWRSDVAVARRPEWYASIKMASTRTIGCETCNEDNMLGLHQGDGVLLHYQSGLEYDDIQPVWDWHRLPGTTCDQGLKSLTPPPNKRGPTSTSSFVGVLGDGENGVAALVYHRAKLSAKKAWFVFDDRIVCLGAGIRGESLGPVYTSVEQRWSGSKALSSPAALTKGTTSLKANNWVHHQGVGYRMLSDATVSIQNVKGDWKRVFPTWPWGEAAGDVFSIWIDHGKSPEDATYAYTLFPEIAEDMMESTTAATILSNTESVQAVTLNGDLSAVFHAPGEVAFNGGAIRVEKPCLLMQRKGQLHISDPTQKEETITVSQGKKSTTVTLPTGQMAGSPAEVH